MRYIIGCKIENKDHTITEGIIMYGYLSNIPYICPFNKFNNETKYIFEDYIVIYDNVEKCKKDITEFSKSYRYEFRKKIKKYNLNPENFKFFALKFDVPRFSHVKTEEKKLRNEKTYSKIVKI